MMPPPQPVPPLLLEGVDRRSEKIVQATDANERKNDQGREVTYKGQQDEYDQIGERHCDQGYVQPNIQAGHCRERNKAEQEVSCFAQECCGPFGALPYSRRSSRERDEFASLHVQVRHAFCDACSLALCAPAASEKWRS